jgi:uncharacterized protein
MVIDITKLLTHIDNTVNININKTFTKEELEQTELLELKDVNIKGTITRDNNDLYYINLTVKGVMTLPCALTLKPVDKNFNIVISEELETYLNSQDKTLENSLDIFPIIWENILMEIPMRVVSEDSNLEELEGDGWRLITDETAKEINNPFKELLETEV